MSLKTVDFPMDKGGLRREERSFGRRGREGRALDRLVLTDGDVQVAALHYVDPVALRRFARRRRRSTASYGVQIVPENVR